MMPSTSFVSMMMLFMVKMMMTMVMTTTVMAQDGPNPIVITYSCDSCASSSPTTEFVAYDSTCVFLSSNCNGSPIALKYDMSGQFYFFNSSTQCAQNYIGTFTSRVYTCIDLSYNGFTYGRFTVQPSSITTTSSTSSVTSSATTSTTSYIPPYGPDPITIFYSCDPCSSSSTEDLVEFSLEDSVCTFLLFCNNLPVSILYDKSGQFLFFNTSEQCGRGADYMGTFTSRSYQCQDLFHNGRDFGRMIVANPSTTSSSSSSSLTSTDDAMASTTSNTPSTTSTTGYEPYVYDTIVFRYSCDPCISPSSNYTLVEMYNNDCNIITYNCNGIGITAVWETEYYELDYLMFYNSTRKCLQEKDYLGKFPTDVTTCQNLVNPSDGFNFGRLIIVSTTGGITSTTRPASSSSTLSSSLSSSASSLTTTTGASTSTMSFSSSSSSSRTTTTSATTGSLFPFASSSSSSSSSSTSSSLPSTTSLSLATHVGSTTSVSTTSILASTTSTTSTLSTSSTLSSTSSSTLAVTSNITAQVLSTSPSFSMAPATVITTMYLHNLLVLTLIIIVVVVAF
eukprot:TRINITY_DN1621_c0_g1_i1.p1 TRINITY_DN1621_c0_g1~~TRINITY_DN1621_c0_g1_i1.p1  ORF type:complete len:564 (-),score=154.76 TRINITY_DN1621_c0_g1_i1:35-1726(-)